MDAVVDLLDAVVDLFFRSFPKIDIYGTRYSTNVIDGIGWFEVWSFDKSVRAVTSIEKEKKYWLRLAGSKSSLLFPIEVQTNGKDLMNEEKVKKMMKSLLALILTPELSELLIDHFFVRRFSGWDIIDGKKLFKDTKHKDENRKILKQLIKKYHPDRGGNTKKMQKITALNTEYKEKGWSRFIEYRF